MVLLEGISIADVELYEPYEPYILAVEVSVQGRVGFVKSVDFCGSDPDSWDEFALFDLSVEECVGSRQDVARWLLV